MPKALTVPELVKKYSARFARRRHVCREIAEVILNDLLNNILGCLKVGESIALATGCEGEDRAMVIVTRSRGKRLKIETKWPLSEARGWWKKLNHPRSGMYHITRAFAERG